MVRSARKEDLTQLSELYYQLHQFHCEIAPQKHVMPQKYFFGDKMALFLNDENSYIFVNEAEEKMGRINGYALFKIIDVDAEEKAPRKVCFIDCIAVDKQERRKGIGKALIEAVTEFGLKKDCNALQLGVDAENENARKFYEKMGLLPRSIIMAKQI